MLGGKVMWVARVVYVESAPPVRVLRWATVEGLQSEGEVTFKENESNGTTVELSVSIFDVMTVSFPHKCNCMSTTAKFNLHL